jgi:hypothetical protein
MLSKKQLEDACRCHLTMCHECEMAGEHIRPEESCVERAAEIALAYRDMLEQLEWAIIYDWDVKDNPMCKCPICGGRQFKGHEADCQLAALLREE